MTTSTDTTATTTTPGTTSKPSRNGGSRCGTSWRRFGQGRPDDQRPKKYVLDMFPYPSGDLHMGHAEAYALGDVIARYWVQRGFSVMHPIGWDAFGLPAENAAIRRGEIRCQWTYDNIAQQKASMRRYACRFDWDRSSTPATRSTTTGTSGSFCKCSGEVSPTAKPATSTGAPSARRCSPTSRWLRVNAIRCDSNVTKKKLTQWYLKITDYADRLLDDMEQLERSTVNGEKVLSMQATGSVRSTGAEVHFEIEGRAEPVTVYTTRPDTLYGATFFVVAADSDLASAAGPAQSPCAGASSRTDQRRQGQANPRKWIAWIPRSQDRCVLAAATPSTRSTWERIPVWASDYVLADYGTGAIMAVPAHDQRDLDFARTFDLPVRVVVDAGEDPAVTGEATADDGPHVNSGPFDGLNKDEAIAAIIEVLAERGTGEEAINYRLRDWLISRQRYWGSTDSDHSLPVVRRGARAR